MKIYDGFQDKRLKPKPRCVAIGIFDGVHRGHQRILRQVVRDAKRYRASPAVITFDPHPSKLLKPKGPQPILISFKHRLLFFKQLGLSETVAIHFDERFSQIPHQVFLDELLIGRLGMRSLSVGDDFRFGCRARGNVSFLRRESRRKGFKLSLVRPLKYKGEMISSTRIRRLIERGNLEKAAKMLGRPVSIYGTVVGGHRRGRLLGIPTANINPHHETLPPDGVYAAWGMLGKRKFKSVVHIGPKPTFGDWEKSLEVHLLGFHGDLYGKDMELLFVKRLRRGRPFKTPAQLARAIQTDMQKTEELLSSKMPP
ncbi:MAG: riboflavin biosynthesis protein RibF [Candidatus Omnitrophica bacterium]|nr:riboflavin biosynthesis protein RibF [Candidatus Omnitrophota bacterium]